MRVNTKLYLKKNKEKPFLNFHPWVFSGAIYTPTSNIEEGSIVEVFSSEEQFIGLGHFHHGSIAVKLFSFEKNDDLKSIVSTKVRIGIDLRKRINLFENSLTNTFRLINAEGDGFPGLIIDIYNNTAVIQAYSKGMYQLLPLIAESLKEELDNTTTIYDKSSFNSSLEESTDISKRFLMGAIKNEIVKENGLNFFVDFTSGQKTGFFIDQRENRKLLDNFSRNKKVLNLFSYSGGFSVYAMKNNAQLIHSVDSSQLALEWLNQNIKLNNLELHNHQSFNEDCFIFLENTTEKYDLIINDPPAFAKHLDSKEKAIKGYVRLNSSVFQKIQTGGIVFTFSCSQVIDKETYRKIIFYAASQCKRNVKILHQLTQPADHPLSVYHPEGEYLKGLVLYVE